MFLVKIEDFIDNTFEPKVDNLSQDILLLENDILINGVKESLDVLYIHSKKKYLIIHGHHRYYIAKKLGLKELPCEHATRELLALYISNSAIGTIDRTELKDLVDRAKWGSVLMQDLDEMEVLVKRLMMNGNLTTILELGVAEGGTLKIWEKLLPQNKNSLLVGVDIDPKITWDYKDSIVNIQIVTGPSEKDSTREAVKKILNGRKVDFLFIDTRHWNDAVKIDLYEYGGFVRDDGIIAFHDLAFFHSYWDSMTWDKPKGDDNEPYHPPNKNKVDVCFRKEEVKYNYGIGILWKIPEQNVLKFREI